MQGGRCSSFSLMYGFQVRPRILSTWEALFCGMKEHAFIFFSFSCLCLRNVYCRYVLSHLLPTYSDTMNRSVWMRWPGKLALFLCSRRAPLGARYRVDVDLYRILYTRLVGVTYRGCLHTVSTNVVCPLWSRSCSV